MQKEITMQDINVFLLAIGTAGAIFMAVSAAVAVYWYLYGRKASFSIKAGDLTSGKFRSAAGWNRVLAVRLPERWRGGLSQRFKRTGACFPLLVPVRMNIQPKFE